jgi:hypothetical protein
MTSESERRDDGVIVVSSQEDERLVHRQVRGDPEHAPDDEVTDYEAARDQPAAAATTTTHASAAGGDWPAIQSMFVDDPRRAVEQAADATAAALDQLLEAARSHEQVLRQQWQGGGSGTEELRTALRGYREFAGRIADLARDF